MLIKKLKNYDILLASKSPRRQQLLKETGVSFEVIDDLVVDERYPSGLDKYSIPLYLAEKKADAYINMLSENNLLITADTIVYLEGKVIGKPENKTDARRILSDLSGKMHEVITGVCILTKRRKHSFYANTEVFFSILSQEEINYYIENFNTSDKAGAYGIQEWIGLVGVERINGSFYNVMGLPAHKLYHELNEFLELRAGHSLL